MILLRADRELNDIFSRLMVTMKVEIEWDGIFAIIDDYLILQGRVRSLFFNFENKKVLTNIIDIPVKEEFVIKTEDNSILKNVLNMILYVFGKWGAIEGLKVEKNYAQLDDLFTSILSEMHIKPDYNEKNYRFYKDGIRLTYEDVIQAAIEAKKEEKKAEEPEEEERLGLWHKICWKKKKAFFRKEETEASERAGDRLGNNFYLVGYVCPECGEKLHMVVYPVDKELLVETEEGRVYLARAYTCDTCSCFYTPTPGKLLAEGDVYELKFGEDRAAYEDYMELLGQFGERTSNYKFNEFEADRNRKKDVPKEGDNSRENSKVQEIASEEEEVRATPFRQEETEKKELDENLEELDEKIESLSPAQCRRLSAKLEEGFYPQKATEGFQKKHGKYLREQEQRAPKETEKKEKSSKKDSQKGIAVQQEKAAKARQKYEARLMVLPRMSQAQLKELKQQLTKETLLGEEQRAIFSHKVEAEEKKRCYQMWENKIKNSGNANYVTLLRLQEELLADSLKEEQKKELLSTLKEQKKKRGEKEVADLVNTLAATPDRRQYQAVMTKLSSYPDIDTTPYTQKLKEVFDAAEKQEIANMVKRARKITRDDYTDLLARMERENFEEGLLKPYQEKLLEKIKELDQKELDKLYPGINMTFDEGVAAYEAMEKGVFLPELKADALNRLDKRLKKIKLDECELLATKFKEQLQGKIEGNERIVFYPARKILLNDADEKLLERFDTAMTIFAADRGRYEFPIALFDTSKSMDGREGVLLSADHLFYGSRFDAGTIPVQKMVQLTAKNGLLNRGIYVTHENGAKIRLHPVVDNQKLMEFTEGLSAFINYLKEKPESRKVTYLAKETHDVICCLRCGYTYRDGNVCPKCGYKVNK